MTKALNLLTQLSRHFAVLMALSLPLYSQLALNEGDTWTYQFASLPRSGFVSAFVENPNGSMTLSVDSSTFQTGDKLRYEIFENSLSESSICSNVLSTVSSNQATCRVDSSWQDLQGAIRLTMLSGSLTVTNITLRVVKPGASLSSYDVYSESFVPVRELPIALAIGLHDDEVIISWPQAGAANFVLQSATNFSTPMPWQNDTNTVYSSGTNYYTTNAPLGHLRVYRLKK